MKALILFLVLSLNFNVFADSDFEKTINVSGKCERKIMPDRVKIHAKIEILNKSQAESTKIANQKYNSLLKVYKSLKLENVEYETTEYRIFPHNPWENRKQVFKGYKTKIGLSVSTSEIKKVGKLLNAGNIVGQDYLSGPNQYVSDALKNKIYKECLTTAIEDANDKASIIAKAAGVKLGRVLSVSESNYSTPRPRPMHRAAMAMESKSMSATPNIVYKSSKLSLSLNVFFAIK